MLPELFRILGAPIWSYGLMLAIAFTAGLWMAVRFAAQDRLPADRVYNLGLILIPSALLGGQVMRLFDSGPSVVGVPRLLASGFGSGSYLGGFLMAVAASAILMRIWRLPWRRTADAFAPSLALGYAITRVGCFLAGCCWGKPATDTWMGVTFTASAHALTGVPIDRKLVPTQLIESGLSLLIFAWLLRLRGRRGFDGQIILAYLVCYSVARFAVEWWRDDPRGSVWGLSLSQFISAILFPLALTYYVRLRPVRADWREVQG